MQSEANTVDQYLQQLPKERKEIVSELRNLILKNLPKGYEEGMLWGMISYYIPLKDYPNTYNKQPLTYLALASQKNYLSLYLNCIYSAEADKEEFEKKFIECGKKLDMGKSCVRFKKLEDLPLDLIAATIAKTTPKEYIEIYEKAREKASK